MKHFSVQLPDGSMLDPDLRDQNSEQYHARLWSNRGRGAATCLCRVRVVGERKLSIRVLKGDRAVIARYPKTSSQHDPDCHWHRDCDASHAYGYTSGVVQVSNEGIITVSYSTRIAALGPDAPSVPKATRDTAGSGVKGQPTISLGGLLALVLEEAEVNQYDPDGPKRDWSFVAFLIARASKNLMVGARPLSSVLVIGRLPNNAAAARILFDQTRKLFGEGFLVIGTMRDLPKPNRDFLPLLSPSYDLIVKIDGQQAQVLRERFRKPAATVNTRGLVIALVQPGPKRRDAWVRDAAVIWTTDDDYIPVASSYEAIVAMRLINQKRRFIKPLRHNRAVGTFPDFLLLDAGPIAVPMEVFGRVDPAYAKNRMRKMQFYSDTYGSNWWSWDATSGDRPPPLPPATMTLSR